MKRAAAELLTLAGLVAAQAFLFGRLVGTDTDYDEGVYLTSLDALEHGQRLGEDVFAPQPPGWYVLLRLISVAGADSVRGFHIGMVVIAIVTCLAAYLLGRSIAGPVAGLAASALLTIAPPFPLYAHRVLADIPPLGAGLLSLWLAWEARERRSAFVALLGGATLALALTLKPTAILVLPAFLLLLLWERSRRGRTLVAATLGGSAVGLAFAVAYGDVLGELWRSVVRYHRDARETPALVDNTHELLTFLNWRTPFAWLVISGVVAAILLIRRRRAPAVWALWLWAAVSAGFLLYQQPLHDNHLLLLPVALAVPAGIAVGVLATRSRFQVAAVGLLALVLVAGYVQQQRRVVLDQNPEEPELVEAAERLRGLTRPDDLVVSDHSIVPYLADRRVAGPLVDTAVLRFETGSLTPAEVLRELDRYDVRAVVVGRAFVGRPWLLRGLAARFAGVPAPPGLRIYVSR
ncbi:MAG: glycosyltransferase family 39 protein [Actinobacteria bacterium]|nr:glycosyltransferase family 39 protein [Actinomycetota bacterium]